MGLKRNSNHFPSKNSAGGPSKREGGIKLKLDLQLFGRMPKNDSQIKHIMRNSEGHLLDTPKNRKTLETISSDKNNFIGTNKHGVDVYAKIIKGIEYWVYVRNDIIQNGGVNKNKFRYIKKK